MGLRDRIAARRGQRVVAADGPRETTTTDAPAPRRRRRGGAMRRAGVGASRGLDMLASIVDLIVAVIALIILAGILFVVLDANTSNTIVSHIHDWAKWLVQPFDGLFKPKDHKVEIAVNWGIALVVYVIIGRIIARLLRRAGPTG
jgi:hypothetical protein